MGKFVRQAGSSTVIKHFEQATAPTVLQGLTIGDLWVDTSGTATLKICTETSGPTFAAVGGATNLTGPITSSGAATAVAAQTGTGSTFVMQASPTLTTPNIGTPTAGVLTNCTGTASGLTAGNVTTNANLTGVVTSTGNATVFATMTSNNVLLGNGTATPQVVAPGTSGNVLTSNGTTWTSAAAAGGGSTYPDPTNTYVWYTDFDGSAVAMFRMATNILGSGAFTECTPSDAFMDSGTHFGVWRQKTGGGAGGRCGIQPSTSQLSIGGVGGGVLTAEVLFYTPAALSDATNDYNIEFGFYDVNGGFDSGASRFVGFRYNHALNSGAWTGCTRVAGSNTTTTDTTTLMTINAWTKLKIVVDSTAANVNFYVNGTGLGTGNPISTNIPSGATKSMTFGLIIKQNAGAVSREMYPDYLWVTKAFSTPR